MKPMLTRKRLWIRIIAIIIAVLLLLSTAAVLLPIFGTNTADYSMSGETAYPTR